MSDANTKHRTKQTKKAQVWLRYLKAGKRKRKGYDAMAAETLQFFHPTHKDFWDESGVDGAYQRGGNASAFCVSVNKAAQLISVLGPRLYQKRPTRTVVSRGTDGVMKAFSLVLNELLNYTPDEAALSREVKRAVIDSLLRGRGFLRVGWDEVHEVITSWWVPSNRVILDPDAEALEDAQWCAIVHYEPVWKVKRRLKDAGVPKWQWEDLQGNCVSDVEKDDAGLRDDQDRWGVEADSGEATDASGTNHILRYFEIYSKQGHGLGRGAAAPTEYKGHDDSKDYVRILIAPGHEYPLEEGAWDMPFYLDSCCGPLVSLDLVETIDQLWPDSVFGQALPHAKAIDLLSTDALEAAWAHTRDIHFVKAEMLDERAREQLTNGGVSEVIEVNAKQPGENLRDIMQRYDTGALSPEIGVERDFHMRQFEQITGMTAPVHGGGATGGIERSATASQLQFDSSMTRLDGMKSDVEDWTAADARFEALAWRTSEAVDLGVVSKIVGDTPLGAVISLKVGGIELPIAGDSGEAALPTLEEIAPEAGTIFYDEQALMAGAQALMQAIQTTLGDPKLDKIRELILADGPNFPGPVPRKATVEDVWDGTAGIGAKELFREFSYKIASVSGERWNKQRAQKFAETAIGQVMPLAMQIGDYETVNKVWEIFFRSFEVPEEDQFQITPPPPPPAPGGPQGGPPQ